MARRVSRQTQEFKVMKVWWIRILLGAISLAIAYGFASIAIDTANMFAYAATFLFGIWSIIQLKNAITLIFSR